MHVVKSLLLSNVLCCLISDAVNVIVLWWLSGPLSLIGFIVMKGTFLCLVIAIFSCKSQAAVIHNEDTNEGEIKKLNNRPIIGVLAQEQSLYLHTKYPEENYTSYIAASYVKDVEAAGARVVPIMIGKDRAYYEHLMSKINGVLLPGGATYFNQSNGYADAGQHIYEIAKEYNDAGDYFPIFGTCLGFELLIILASGRGKQENRVRCYSYSNLPLNFTDDFSKSKMFKSAAEDLIDVLSNEDVTVNAHQFCIVDDNLVAYNLTNDWRVTSHSHDDHGVEFIASVEHKRYPFFGVQFHPEKSSFEWKLSKNYPHSSSAIKANRYFMDFFIDECKMNFHSFSNASEENAYLIYNYEPKFTGILGSAYHQCYLFEPRGTVDNSIRLLSQ